MRTTRQGGRGLTLLRTKQGETGEKETEEKTLLLLRVELKIRSTSAPCLDEGGRRGEPVLFLGGRLLLLPPASLSGRSTLTRVPLNKLYSWRERLAHRNHRGGCSRALSPCKGRKQQHKVSYSGRGTGLHRFWRKDPKTPLRSEKQQVRQVTAPPSAGPWESACCHSLQWPPGGVGGGLYRRRRAQHGCRAPRSVRLCGLRRRRSSRETCSPAVRSQSLTNPAPFLSPLIDCQKCQRLEIPWTRGIPFQGQILALPAILTWRTRAQRLLPGWAAFKEARPRGGACDPWHCLSQFTAK